MRNITIESFISTKIEEIGTQNTSNLKEIESLIQFKKWFEMSVALTLNRHFYLWEELYNLWEDYIILPKDKTKQVPPKTNNQSPPKATAPNTSQNKSKRRSASKRCSVNEPPDAPVKLNVELYTDGSCFSNPGKGGYAAILIQNNVQSTISQGYANTTNNRMEIMGVLKGLELLKDPSTVTVYSDSQYVVNAVNLWIYNWQKNGWRRNEGELKNADLWRALYDHVRTHKVKAVWIKAHNGHVFNEKCDRLAKKVAKSKNLLVDNGFMY